MKNKNLEKKKVFSFDKTYSSIISFAQPDKYKSLENISKDHRKIINAGSNLSYSPLGFCEDGISIDLKKFNRIIELDKENKTITVEAGITLIEFLNFENPHFQTGTKNILNAIANKTIKDNIFSVAGGGETVAAINKFGDVKSFTFVSTAGGAFLEYLEGKTLPGIKALNNHE